MSDQDRFKFDVFLSHSSIDKDTVRDLAERLRDDGLRVWFDDWKIKPGDSIPSKVNEGLEQSRVLVLCVSANASDSDWAQFESQAILFLDPLNKSRRFIPLRLDETPVKSSLAQFRYINWLPDHREQQYAKLLEAIAGPASSQPHVVWRIASSNPAFTGREDVLAQSRTVLNKKNRLALQGMVGTGKTRIAIEYARRHQRKYDVGFFVNASTRSSLISGFLELATALDLPVSDQTTEPVLVSTLTNWLAETSRWLLILDNADDLSIVQDILPIDGSGHLVITTCDPGVSKFAPLVRVRLMTESEGAQLLLSRAGLAAEQDAGDGKEALYRDAKKLSEDLGGLPLALDQAGAFMLEAQYGPAEYRRLFKQREIDLLNQPDHLTDVPSVAATFSLAFANLQDCNPTTADLLRLFAFFGADAIPESLVIASAPQLTEPLSSEVADELSFIRTISPAYRFALLERDKPAKAIVMHRLLQAIIRHGMSADEQRKWVESVVRILASAFPDAAYPSQWTECNQLLTHATAAATRMCDIRLNTPEAMILLNRLSAYSLVRGHLDNADQWIAHANDLSPDNLDPRIQATMYNNHGVLCRSRQEFSKAEVLLKDALRIRETNADPQNLETAETLHNLAWLMNCIGEYDQQRTYATRALEIRQQALGRDHPIVGESLNDLATYAHAKCQFDAASEYLAHASAIAEKTLGPNHLEFAVMLYNVAVVKRLCGDYDESLSYGQRALEVYDKCPGPIHSNAINCLINLANVHRDLGNYEEATRYARWAQKITEERFGKDTAKYVFTLTQVAEVELEQGHHVAAESILEQIRETAERVWSGTPLNMAIFLRCQGRAYEGLGRLDDAELNFRRALEMRKEKHGDLHVATAMSQYDLGRVLDKLKQHDQAKELLVQAEQTARTLLRENHPHTATYLHGLGEHFATIGKFPQAKDYFTRALTIRATVLPEGHPATKKTRKRLADLSKRRA